MAGIGLQDGIKYNCLQGNSSSAKKAVIFVKLTDSALRAIEDYLHIQQKTRQHATLQFLGNDGRIHIPSSHANDGHSFDFSLSSSTETEGPQGSFECIQQCGNKSLESMGTLPFKLRIHAKDDVYDLTRQRINFVEDKRKQDCAKEIKQPNADNGRKVKKKLGGGHHLLLPHRREPSPISNYSNNSKPNSLLSTSTSSKLTNGYSINNGSHYYGGNHQSINNNYKHNGPNTHGNGPTSKMVNMDITRRPLRERLIHMLALKPLKKPELMTKIYKDGIKDKEKKMLMMVLQQVSQLKDNVYNLSRGIWNDVHEDWPFYTEEERQIMKRRKPQNLTPPGSDCSVGSVGSGTSSSSSPRSTTSGSGISPTSYPTTTATMSHNNYPSNNHLNQAGQPMKSSSNYSSHNHNNNSNNSNVIGTSLPGQVMQQQSQGVKRPGFFDSNNNGGGGGNGVGGGQQVNNDNIPSKKPRVSHFKRPNCSNSANNNIRVENRDRDSPKNTSSRDSPKSKDSPNSNKEMPLLQQQRSGNSHNSSMGNGHNQDRLSPTGNGLAPHSNHQNPNPKFLCVLQSDNMLDYFYSDFTTIRTLEQRNRYRAAFNAEYTEYRDLHSVIDKVSKKFAQLEERLRQEDKGSEGYQIVRDQIISEYNYNKNSKEYTDARQRFAYMHEKLSHIKQLVLDYDTAHSSSGGPGCPDSDDF